MDLEKWALSAVQHLVPQSGLVFSSALCCKPDSRTLTAAPQIRGAVGKVQVAKSQKSPARPTIHCLISSTIESLGHVFAGNNQATPTNSIISSVFLLEHRGRKLLNSTLGSVRCASSSATLSQIGQHEAHARCCAVVQTSSMQ